MANIQQYDQRVTAQGSLGARATGDDFGAQVGRAEASAAEARGAVSRSLSNVGQGLMSVGEAMYQNEVNDEVTRLHTAMSEKRVEWSQRLDEMRNQTKPGDQTLMPRVMEGLKQDFENMSSAIKTRQAQQRFAAMSAGMTAELGTQARAMQADLNGQFAKNQYSSLSKNLGVLAAQDHTKVESLLKQGMDAINDPDGQFARVPEPTREAFRQGLKEDIEFFAAKGFARRFPAAVLGVLPGEVRNKVQEVVANPPAPGVPPDLKAPLVKPYDQDRIDKIAKTVAAPSPYDKAFQDAARLYNLDWRELKMRSVAESGLNPTAVSSQNAGGIMQLTPETAAQLGVDRNDPVASIHAAAKLIAGYRAKAGGDMSRVDMMYYGGEGGTAWGPNTKQYAANLSAVRGAVGLGTSVSPEQFANSPTAAVGSSQDWVKPKTGVAFIDNLPADKFFNVLTEAEHYQRAYDSMGERARIEANHAQQVQAESTMNLFTQRIVAPSKENGGRLTEVEIAANPTLNSAQKQHMMSFLNTHTREQQSRMEPKANPGAVRDIMLRIHAPDNDPAKIYSNEPIYDALSKGRISTAEFAYLSKEVTELKSSSTNGFRRDVNNLRGQVARTLQQNVQLQAMEMAAPGTIADISYRFERDLEQQIDSLRKENKNPNVLLDPSKPEYALRPGRLQQFFPGSQVVAQGAANTAAAQVNQLPTYKDYDSLKSGESYTDPQGNVRVKR